MLFLTHEKWLNPKNQTVYVHLELSEILTNRGCFAEKLDFLISRNQKFISDHSVSQNMADYNAIKSSLEKNGELMLRLDTGDKIELHKHNVTFEESTQEIVVDAGTETIWIPADKVAYYMIHREGFEKE